MAAKKELSGMDIINNQIKTSEFSNIYLMGGDEAYLLYQYRDKLLSCLGDREDSMNFCVFKGENAKVDAIAEFALTMPFFADRRVLLVENSDFFKSGNEAMEKVIQELPDTTVIVFVESNIDKRNKLFKAVQGRGTVAMFSTPSEKTLLVWLKKLFTEDNIAIEDNAVFRLLESVGTDMCTLSNEVDKLKGYCIEKGCVTAQDVEEISVSQVENKIFEMMDALSLKDRNTAMSRYNDLLLLREPAMRILFLITRQFNILVRIKLAQGENKSYSELASIAKVPPFTVKNYIKQCEGYTYEELLERLNFCQEADTFIKTGRYSDKMAVEMLMIKIMQ